MQEIFSLFINLWIKLFFVLTPFFALTMFLGLTEGRTEKERRKLAASVVSAVAIICLVLFLAGRQIFAIFGITLDSFRIGSGILLLLSGIALVHGAPSPHEDADGDIALVPLAIPIVVGPATTGTMLVMGAELTSFGEKLTGCLSLFAAVACLGAVLMAGAFFERVMGRRGIAMLSRVTGLVLVAMASQMIMTGVRAFLVLTETP